MRWIGVAVVVGMMTLPAIGQTTMPADEVTLPPSLAGQLGTVTGIVAATLIVVQVLKRVLRDVPVAESVPLWVYAVTVAAALTMTARYALGCLDGQIVELLWQATIGAATASGVFSWLNQPGANPGNSGTVNTQKSGGGQTWAGVAMAVGLAGVLASSSGCAMTGSQQYVAATHTYSGTLAALTTLSKAEMIPLADLERIEVVRAEAAKMLDEMKAAVVRKDPLTVQWYAMRIQALLDELVALQIRAEARKSGTLGKAVSYGIGGDPGGRVGGPVAGDAACGGGGGDSGRAARGDGRGDRPGRTGPGDGRDQLGGGTPAETGGGRRLTEIEMLFRVPVLTAERAEAAAAEASTIRQAPAWVLAE